MYVCKYTFIAQLFEELNKEEKLGNVCLRRDGLQKGYSEENKPSPVRHFVHSCTVTVIFKWYAQIT